MIEFTKATLIQHWRTIGQWSAIVIVIVSLIGIFREYLKGGTETRLMSLRWRTLTRRGFRIAPDPRAGRLRRRKINRLSKHPAALLVLGFVLTGVIGNGLVALQEHRERERESLVKSMNDLRAAYDDLSAAFANYYYRARLLINLQQDGATADAIAEARKASEAASEKWQERLVADSPTIDTLHEQATGDSRAGYISEDMKVATGLVDDCIASNKPVRDPNSTEYMLECGPRWNKDVTALSRLLTLSNCMKTFAMFMRPDPRFDFYITGNDVGMQRASGVLETACDVKRYFEGWQEMMKAVNDATKTVMTRPSK